MMILKYRISPCDAFLSFMKRANNEKLLNIFSGFSSGWVPL